MPITRMLRIDGADDLQKVIVDESSSAITYIGRALTQAATTSQSVWQIQRITVSGSVTTREFAANGEYNQVWDNRTALFPTASLLNTYSLAFPGTDDYVSFGNAHLYDVGTQFTMSFWVYPNNFGAQRGIYSKVTYDANVDGLNLQVDTAGKIFLQVRSGAQQSNYTGSLSLTALAWNHVVLTYSGNNNQNGFRVYVNSVVDSVPASSAKTLSILSGQVAALGVRGTAFFWSGNIDEVSFWSIGMNQAEVTELYNLGTPTDLVTHSQSARLDSWYRCGDGDAYPTIIDHAGTYDGTMTNMTAGSIVTQVP